MNSFTLVSSGQAAHRRCRRGKGRLLFDDGGSPIAEFALTLPLLALIIMASMAVMEIVEAQFGVQAAAREAVAVGAQVSSSLDPYSRSVVAAQAEAERVIQDYGLDLARATITFNNNDPLIRRGTFFQAQISYDVVLPTPTLRYFEEVSGSATFTVQAIAVYPVQKHKARWPCPSPDPICS